MARAVSGDRVDTLTATVDQLQAELAGIQRRVTLVLACALAGVVIAYTFTLIRSAA